MTTSYFKCHYFNISYCISDRQIISKKKYCLNSLSRNRNIYTRAKCNYKCKLYTGIVIDWDMKQIRTIGSQSYSAVCTSLMWDQCSNLDFMLNPPFSLSPLLFTPLPLCPPSLHPLLFTPPLYPPLLALLPLPPPPSL